MIFHIVDSRNPETCLGRSVLFAFHCSQFIYTLTPSAIWMAFLGTVRHSALRCCQGLGACHCGCLLRSSLSHSSAVRTLQHTAVAHDFARTHPILSRTNGMSETVAFLVRIICERRPASIDLMLGPTGQQISPVCAIYPGRPKGKAAVKRERSRESLSRSRLTVPQHQRRLWRCPPRLLKIGSALRFEWLAWIKAASRAAASQSTKQNHQTFKKLISLGLVRGAQPANLFCIGLGRCAREIVRTLVESHFHSVIRTTIEGTGPESGLLYCRISIRRVPSLIRMSQLSPASASNGATR